jgi:HK97 family phage major capsid protein/HK97 family phage prohead protease
MHRAYSLFTIKSVDEEQRIIEGIATTPSTDRMGDIVEPEGAQFNLPIPLLWQHNSREPVGEVVAAKATPEGITFQAQFAKIPEAGTLKDRIDNAWQSIKYKLVKGMSIGFNPIESSQIKDTWAEHFLKWEWLELSCVTIPANVDASITSIKSADEALLAALGDRPRQVVRLSSSPGASGPQHNLPKGNSEMKTIAEQIASFEAKRQASAARMTEIMAKAAEEGRTLNEAETQEYDTLKAEVKAVDEHLARLKDHEKQMVAGAVEVIPAKVDGPDAAAKLRGTGTIISVKPPRLEPGIKMARYAMALLRAKGNLNDALSLVQNNKAWMDSSPELAQVLKAAVAAGDTTTSTWASELVYAQNLASEFIEFLRPQTIIGKIPGLTKIPFNVRIAGQNAASSAFWVGQGQPVPMSKLGTFAITLGIAKAAGLVAVDDELVRSSSPSAEMLVRNDLGKSIAQFLDTQFLNPDFAAVANVSPASILNGVTPITPSGTTSNALRADVQTLIDAWLAANMDPSLGVWIMAPTQALSLSMMLNPLGQPLYPEINMLGGTLFGLPVITSMSAKLVGSPAYGSIIALINAPAILLADDGEVTISTSSEASLQMMDTTAVNESTGPTNPTTVVSMFQTNSLAIKAVRYINWAKARATAAQFIQNAAYVSGS